MRTPPPSFRFAFVGSVLIFGLLAAPSCSPPGVEKHQLADGTWKLLCRRSMAVCVQEVEELCPDKSYVITRGANVQKYLGVEPGRVEIKTSELEVRCGHNAVEEQTAASPASSSAPPAPPAARVCTPGATQACLGPGACSGAQACRADGFGFSACDCGASPKAASAASDAGAASVADAAPRAVPEAGAPSAADAGR